MVQIKSLINTLIELYQLLKSIIKKTKKFSKNLLFSSSISNSDSIEINDADCLPRGYSTNYTRNNQIISIKGEGDFINCTKHLVMLLNLNATCLRKPCSFNGVYQPEINYNSQDFYGFSEFWYTMQGLKKKTKKLVCINNLSLN